MIPFNVPPYLGGEDGYVIEAMRSHKICGDGAFTKRANELLERLTGAKRALLTTSCTSALEMAAILADIKAGDEVIMPSYTFVSTANAFALRGAQIVFVDIRPDTMNIDEKLIEAAITSKTKAIATVDYAGVCCEMDAIGDIAHKYGLFTVEDAAQAIGSFYRGRAAGSLCDAGCLSFHETKNLSMGEGGAILLGREGMADRAEIIREKGTDRSRFYRGQVDKYTWVDIGSSYLPSEMNAAYLCYQLEHMDAIQASRMAVWERYHERLAPLEEEGLISRPFIPDSCEHNAHMYYIKLADMDRRRSLIDYLAGSGVMAVFHYIPLHSSPAGLRFGRFFGEDRYTTRESERLLRLPMYYGMTTDDADMISEIILRFFERKGRDRA